MVEQRQHRLSEWLAEGAVHRRAVRGGRRVRRHTEAGAALVGVSYSAVCGGYVVADGPVALPVGKHFAGCTLSRHVFNLRWG